MEKWLCFWCLHRMAPAASIVDDPNQRIDGQLAEGESFSLVAVASKQ
jgi:hypothetical protein